MNRSAEINLSLQHHLSNILANATTATISANNNNNQHQHQHHHHHHHHQQQQQHQHNHEQTLPHQQQHPKDHGHSSSHNQKLKSTPPTSALPRGWKREEFSRPRGLSNGKYKVHYINETGQRFKNKCMLSRFMGAEVDLTPFDWRTGKIDPYLKRKVERMIKLRDSSDVNRRLRNDHSIKPPLRTTVSNFKLPVTIYRNQPKEQPPVQPPTNSVITRQIQNQIKQANNHEQQRALLAAAEAKSNNFKPRQIFWEKRLEGINACINDENQHEKFHLPSKIKSVVPEYLEEESIVRAIVTSLYDRNNTITVTGQSATSLRVSKNPAIFLDPYQPPTMPILIDDNDLKRQEERVHRYRRELEKILKAADSANYATSTETVPTPEPSSTSTITLAADTHPSPKLEPNVQDSSTVVPKVEFQSKPESEPKLEVEPKMKLEPVDVVDEREQEEKDELEEEDHKEEVEGEEKENGEQKGEEIDEEQQSQEEIIPNLPESEAPEAGSSEPASRIETEEDVANEETDLKEHDNDEKEPVDDDMEPRMEVDLEATRESDQSE